MKIKSIILIILSGIIVAGSVYYFINRNTETKVLSYSTSTEALTVLNKPVPEAITVQKEIISKVTEDKKIMNATLHTNKGDVTIEFNPNTPKTVENFIKLAKEGFYDGTKFHRVIVGFMNQGGDPLTKDDTMMARWGTGGPGYQFNDEIGADNNNAPGTIAMANSGPNTNGSQFFINAADNSFLNTKHTVFGMVTAGADVVMAINNVAVGEADRPIEPVIINSISLK